MGTLPNLIEKFIAECRCVNGVRVSGIYDGHGTIPKDDYDITFTKDIDELLEISDAVYISSDPADHYGQIKKALMSRKNVLCESPITLDDSQTRELFALAEEQSCVLQEGLKTAYATAYERMMLLLKSNVIGDIVSVDATCTSLSVILDKGWSGVTYWAPTALLPGLQIFGTSYKSSIKMVRRTAGSDYVIMTMVYPCGIVTIRAGSGVKSEGSLVISGTKGYLYVPSPWWKTDYFEVRYENPADNRKFFYQLDGEGIRYEIVDFLHTVNGQKKDACIDRSISIAISKIMKEIAEGTDTFEFGKDI